MKLETLQGHIPDDILVELPDLGDKFGINTEFRLAHLLGQCKQESGNFAAFSENLNYKSIDRLKAVFPSTFKTDAVTSEFVGHPEKIANEVYSDKLGNGNRDSGDGWKYRGRGAIGLTGRANYQSLSNDSGIDFIANPDLLAGDYKMYSAAWFFKKFGLLEIADRGIDDETCRAITHHVNGNLMLGLENRTKYTTDFYNLLVGW